MATRVGINGFGRIGRAFTRLAAQRTDLAVVGVNDVADPRTLAHLLEFDSTYGRLGQPVEFNDHALIVGGRRIAVMAERDPAAIDWGALGADIVVESTGKFRGREAAAVHLKGRAPGPPGRSFPPWRAGWTGWPSGSRWRTGRSPT